MLAVASHVVEGQVSPGFEAVRAAFDENFERRGELGGACCAYYRGQKVVDKPCENWPFGGPRSFGSPGASGALGFADPDAGIGYAYVTSRMGMVFTGDPRDLALRDALYSALPG